MNYTPYLPNPFEVFNETICSGDFNYLIFIAWTAIVFTGMFSFNIFQCMLPRYQKNRIILTSEIIISLFIKLLLFDQFFPSMFTFTFYYFFVFLLICLFASEYIKLPRFLSLSQKRLISILWIVFLLYAFYIVTIRNLYNSTYHLSDVYTTEDLFKYIR